jgi:LAS superfamily LD-carboxypeptidase LdcB
MPYGRNNVYGFAYEPWHWSQLGQRGKRQQKS